MEGRYCLFLLPFAPSSVSLMNCSRSSARLWILSASSSTCSPSADTLVDYTSRDTHKAHKIINKCWINEHIDEGRKERGMKSREWEKMTMIVKNTNNQYLCVRVCVYAPVYPLVFLVYMCTCHNIHKHRDWWIIDWKRKHNFTRTHTHTPGKQKMDESLTDMETHPHTLSTTHTVYRMKKQAIIVVTWQEHAIYFLVGAWVCVLWGVGDT